MLIIIKNNIMLDVFLYAQASSSVLQGIIAENI